ncbi:MAG: glycoside hydrolase family 15 protein [Phycisphaerae bacterium]|jgi:GH15 family glucan-1,4-alpha-glucosidase
MPGKNTDNMNYGIIGNCSTAALVSDKGCIEWCCMPFFDSTSMFAAILDKNKGGHFSIVPKGDYKITQQYLRKTNILVTKFTKGKNVFEVIDFFPRYKMDNGNYHCPPDIIRYIRWISGKPTVTIDYKPRPGFAQYPTKSDLQHDFIKYCTNGGKYESIYLYSDLKLADIIKKRPITIKKDHYLVVSYNQKIILPDIDKIRLELERTKAYWMGWIAKNMQFPKYQDQIERSSLVLKLLAYQKTGAIIAAPTTSLPETIGDVRNWDYRYCWIRDASMTISTLIQLGHFNVAKRFLQFVLDIVPYKDEKIRIMYPIQKNKKVVESTIPWLAGYKNSKPVRIGNAAFKQKQNDIYGVMMDVIYQGLCNFKQSIDNQEDLWTVVRTLTRHVRNNWQKLDSSIWEFRTERKHFTFSKILCWVAMDRAVKIAQMFNKPGDAVSYAQLRDKIKKDVLKKGYNPELKSLVQTYGGHYFDSANLLAEHFGFLGAKDQIYIDTVRQTYKRLCVDGLMYRYKSPDDFGTPKSSFIVCTFWMIKSLYRIGDKELAVKMFERILGLSNHLGLFSEDMDFKSKRLLGNFPQGYSHLALIDAAMTITGKNQDRLEDKNNERI